MMQRPNQVNAYPSNVAAKGGLVGPPPGKGGPAVHPPGKGGPAAHTAGNGVRAAPAIGKGTTAAPGPGKGVRAAPEPGKAVAKAPPAGNGVKAAPAAGRGARAVQPAGKPVQTTHGAGKRANPAPGAGKRVAPAGGKRVPAEHPSVKRVNVEPAKGKWAQPVDKVSSTATSLVRRKIILVALAATGLAVAGGIIAAAVILTANNGGANVCTSWGAWSPCSATCETGKCGLGTRNRTCTDKTTDPEVLLCGTPICPDCIYGSWSTWSQWSGCSLTCGNGTQARLRNCAKYNDTVLDCKGQNVTSRQCNTFVCIDCNYKCPDGSELNDKCSYCICKNATTFSTKVVTPVGTPLEGVSVRLTGYEVIEVANSPFPGFVNISELCNDTNVTFTKSDYVSLTYEVGNLPANVTMSRAAALTVVASPVSKKRVVGEPIKFCCSFDGNPPPTYIEWLENNQVIYIDYGTSNSSLSIANVTMNEATTFSCRANIDQDAVGAVRTAYAQLQVEVNAAAFCSVTPISKWIELPTNCSLNGNTTIDIGQCISGKCRGQGDASTSCIDEESYCCGPVNQTSVSIDCGDFDYQVFKVQSCGCQRCENPQINIIGTVTDTNDTALAGIEITYSQSVIDSTDYLGKFYMKVPLGTTRIAVTATDRNNTYVSTSAVLNLSPAAEGTYYLKIVMLPQPPPVNFSSTDDATVLISSSESGDNLGEIIIPKSSYYLSNGEQYNGTVLTVVTVLSPNDTAAMMNAPGDFSSIDVEGERNPLESLGMFKIDLFTEAGESLAVPNIEVGGPEMPQTSNNETLQLWTFNPDSCIWETADTPTGQSSRRKRATPNMGVPYLSRWYNFDYVSTSTCYSKVRVYEDNSFNPRKQITGAVVEVIIADSQSWSKSVSNLRPYGDNDANGYCVAHRCRRNKSSSQRFRGYVSASKNGQYYRPESNQTANLGQLNYDSETYPNFIVADLDMTAKTPYPFYDWNYHWQISDACVKADVNQKHFRFFESDKCVSKSRRTIPQEYFRSSSTCHLPNYFLWNSMTQVINRNYSTCFVRVGTFTNDRALNLHAYSTFGINITKSSILARTLFGEERACVKSNYTCIEVKYPDDIGCSIGNPAEFQPNYTNVGLEILDNEITNQRFKLGSVNRILSSQYYNISNDQFIFRMHKDLVNAIDRGVFCHSGESSPVVSQSRARTLCEQERDPTKIIVSFGDTTTTTMQPDSTTTTMQPDSTTASSTTLLNPVITITTPAATTESTTTPAATTESTTTPAATTESTTTQETTIHLETTTQASVVTAAVTMDTSTTTEGNIITTGQPTEHTGATATS